MEEKTLIAKLGESQPRVILFLYFLVDKQISEKITFLLSHRNYAVSLCFPESRSIILYLKW
jgi:hypothetical protein